MTLKEAVIKSLEDINDITNYMAVCNHVIEKNYYDFSSSKTPSATVSSVLGDYIRNGDTRVKRIKQDGGTYSYYLTKNEQNISIEVLSGTTQSVKKRYRLKLQPKRVYKSPRILDRRHESENPVEWQ